tara:strand:+ start:508 stop:1146 length:639 start_codon:yes stop_codon:yes gene_type:complete
MNEYIKITGKVKKQISSKTIENKLIDESFRIKESIYDIQNKRLSKKIKNLPKDIQKKIYIYGMKNLWKNNILFYPLKPIWQDYLEYVNKEKSKILLKNINFMHLDFNTLPENKEYISGCQCDYCKGFPQEDKDELYNYINYNEDRFYKSIGVQECLNIWGTDLLPLNWFSDTDTLSMNDISSFNFMKGNFEEPLKYSSQEAPLYFSYELVKI